MLSDEQIIDDVRRALAAETDHIDPRPGLLGRIHDELGVAPGSRRTHRLASRGRRLLPGFRRPGGSGRSSGLLAIGLSVVVVLVVITVASEIRRHHTSTGAGVPHVLPLGSSLNPSGPTGVIASTAQLAAVVPDPEGSGPAWGIKTYRTQGGQTCFQVGREQSGRIGAVGAYGSFGDDGHFHPFTFTDVGFGTCVATDADQHAFDNVAYANAPASASGEPCQTVPRRVLSRMPAQLRARLSAQSHAADCEPRNQRVIAFGLLGPDATSVTYRTARGTATTRTHGPDGAYLIVEPVDPALCGQSTCGYSGGGRADSMSLPQWLIATITYGHAPACHVPPVTRVFARFAGCNYVGYVAPRRSRVTGADVASPVSVRALPGDGPFCGNDEGGLFYVCKPGQIPLDGTTPMIVLQVSFVARVAVRDAFSGYYVQVQNPGNCGGSGGTINHNVGQDARVTVQQELQTRCKGTFHGSIEYIPNTGPGGRDRAIAGVRVQGALTVGTFTYRLTKLPGPTASTPNGVLDGTLGLCCSAAGSTPEPGTIIVRGAHGTQRYVYPGRSGHFTVSLPPGRYGVVGGIPTRGWKVGRCRSFPANSTSTPSLTVAVNSARTTTISVLCQGQ